MKTFLPILSEVAKFFTCYKNFKEFNYDRIFVEETLWDKKGSDDEFIIEVEGIGAKDILVVSEI